MTKPQETLRRPIFKDDVLNSHIVDTYFHQKSRHKTRKRKDTDILELVKFAKKISLALAISAISILILVIIVSFFHAQYMIALKKRVADSKIVNIISDGNVNREILRHFEFRGYTRKGKSRITKDEIIINNPKKYNWGDLAIDFKFPIDMTSRNINLSLRGSTGGERVNVVIRDVNNKSCILKNLYLSSSWKDEVLNMAGARHDVDISKINHIRIECGYPGESSKDLDSLINFTIYVKNFSLPKEM